MIEEKLIGKDNQQQRVLPSALLSDDTGLRLWSQITHLPNYYQTRDEIELLEYHGAEIARHILPGSTIIDLGCGDVRKIKPLLDVIEAIQTPIRYFALDLSRQALEECMRQLESSYRFVSCFGLWGSFDDALRWSAHVSSPRWFLSLGSIFGNDWLEPAVARLATWARAMRPQDRMLLGMDARECRQQIWDSYHDEEGLFKRFIRNGMYHANRVMDCEWYRDEDWEVEGVMMEEPIMHRFVIRAVRDVGSEKLGVRFAKGDEIDCYEAFKYDPAIMHGQFEKVGLMELAIFKAPASPIYEYLLSVPPSAVPTNGSGVNFIS
ncbi:hypothetical protein GP486_004108 [Trichoglossum hirsutum]|uniref:4-dimethylallyltryptophan N-methyltransferase n=1 Tax=Trichoglossum hirsutum TaxID=265104 RepID=A0A9P8LBQ5_9PEZI|nr:hypothetical protein GP486_004108 [Trichoglossum hirsutum]